MKNNIEIRNLHKNYPGFSLEDVSFDVPAGSIVGFVGKNGAGKTTTIKTILNVIAKDSGSITILGENNVGGASQAHKYIGVVFDESSFHDWLRPNQVANILRGTFESWDDDYFLRLIQKMDLAEAVEKNEMIKTFSRGMKMKFSLAAAMAHHPKLLILDEATSGLDPIVRDEIYDLFLEFIADEEHSILFSSHITSDIEKAADYLVFIHKGRIIMNGGKDELLACYGVLRCRAEQLKQVNKNNIVGVRQGDFGVEALINNRSDFKLQDGMVLDAASIDDIMLYTIRGNEA